MVGAVAGGLTVLAALGAPVVVERTAGARPSDPGRVKGGPDRRLRAPRRRPPR
ncbi:hypothetical protein [Modestobacter marinus]|uniref:hypothetical protein n=1 Tax=Modestobacter marinus TaxID=477641 RepID=UPI001C97EADB|nr:hypothetical protein [Modestobacter marinus]